jgi:hydroxypyruvate isomerase
MAMTRREMMLASAALVAGSRLGQASVSLPDQAVKPTFRQSVSRWPFAAIPLAAFARDAKAMGLAAVDLLQPAEWPVVAEAGLVCSMGYPTDRDDFIATGFNDRAHHAMLLRELETTLPMAARAGVPNVIAMFGNRNGRSDAEAIANCVAGLQQIAPLAEETGVTICVELLNSKVDHKNYQGDRTAFGVEVIQAIGSPRVLLLYDIYHMQIMEGDVIHTIRDNAASIGHYHTGGVPGRHELDGSQELNYGAIARAISGTGFTGYVAHEFMPTKEPLAALREAVAVCNS